MSSEWTERETKNLRLMVDRYKDPEQIPWEDIADVLRRTPDECREHHQGNQGTKFSGGFVTCPQCWEPFEVKGSQTYCSKSCAAKSRPGIVGRAVRAKVGKREDLGGTFFRSAMEANYARYLQFLKESDEVLAWQYEPKCFEFANIKRGNRHYTPDFLVTFSDGHTEWHEVKGWMDKNSQVKLKRFRKYYPEEADKLAIIDKTVYADIRKQVGGLIPNWE